MKTKIRKDFEEFKRIMPARKLVLFVLLLVVLILSMFLSMFIERGLSELPIEDVLKVFTICYVLAAVVVCGMVSLFLDPTDPFIGAEKETEKEAEKEE